MKLIFDTIEKANTALNQININKQYPYDSINSKTKEVCPDAQKVTSWDIVRKIYNQNLWYFEKPDIEFMTNVDGYTEQVFSYDWEEPLT
jgi:hypothetical protein